MAALFELRSSRSGPPAVNPSLDLDGGSDDALVCAAQRGDRTAFGLLYARYSRMVHGILLARVPFSDVDDLVQEVFLQALPRLSTLRRVSRFPGWLASIARNRPTDFHRRVKPNEDLDKDSPSIHSDSPTPPTTPSSPSSPHPLDPPP